MNRSTFRRATMTLLAGSLAGLATVASAQDTSATPNYGAVTLDTGFLPDPHVVQVTSGGSVDATTLNADCAGTISSAPDFELTYRAGSLPLIIRAIADDDRDITLVVNDAQGNWVCDDDSGEGLNPKIVFNQPGSGVYDIWVGTFSGGEFVPARLEISEIDDSVATVDRSGLNDVLDYSASALSGEFTLNSGFTPDPRRFSATAGGAIRANEYDSRCAGFVSRAPDLQISYSAGSLPLIFSTRSDADTTLIINDANGNWFCDDDSGGNLNAQIIFDAPSSGVYDVWVGSFSGDPAPASILVSEIRR